MPPVRFFRLRKPLAFSWLRASALRLPLRQCRMISSFGFSSPAALDDLAERDQFRAGNAGDAVLVGFAHINDGQFFAPIHAGFQFLHRDLFRLLESPAAALLRPECRRTPRNLSTREWSDCRRKSGSSGLFLVSIRGTHFQRVEQQQTSDERLADAQNQFDRLVGLNAAHDARQTPSTPPSAQDGTRPGGGGSGYRQR